jgi:phosphate-selective porin OprO/OprP
MQFVARTFVDDGANPQIDQFAFRSVRPLFEGTLTDRFAFRLLPDFAGGKLVLQDAYTDVKLADTAQLRVGKLKVAFGLERWQSETTTTFVERGLPAQLEPNRDLGVMLFGTLAGGVVEYELGVFNGVADGASGDGDVSDGKEGSARVFVQPFVNGASIAKGFGFGGAATFGQKNGTAAQPDLPVFKTQGQVAFFQYDPMAIADGHQWRATAQADYYAGPIGVLTEYVRSVQRAALGDTASHVTADAWQVLAQWVVTGEDATFKSVTPSGANGAIDVAARVGQLRLDDNAFLDGLVDPRKSAQRATSAGVGADWFVNKNVRLALDLERTSFTGGWKGAGTAAVDRPDETSIIGRVQTAF